ncbi:MAG: hypothetical protein LBS92_06120 [Candidatus Methanoplasma sp.]|jgi:hypothetical protein|nr:hypothetical protein [Candidatus Methanoplasma sp.]
MTQYSFNRMTAGDVTLSDSAWDDRGHVSPECQSSPTASCSEKASGPRNVPKAPKCRNLEEEDHVVCLRLGREYEDLPYRATFFEKLDFFIVSEDLDYVKYRSTFWPRTKITFDKLYQQYVVEIDARNRKDRIVYCTVDDMINARYSGELVLG